MTTAYQRLLEGSSLHFALAFFVAEEALRPQGREKGLIFRFLHLRHVHPEAASGSLHPFEALVLLFTIHEDTLVSTFTTDMTLYTALGPHEDTLYTTLGP